MLVYLRRGMYIPRPHKGARIAQLRTFGVSGEGREGWIWLKVLNSGFKVFRGEGGRGGEFRVRWLESVRVFCSLTICCFRVPCQPLFHIL